MSKKYNLYLGKAGQLAAMASFLVRGWNVATPEVDVGDDLFVVEDNSLGSLFNGRLMLYFSFQDEKVTCSDVDITKYLNNFDDFPIIIH